MHIDFTKFVDSTIRGYVLAVWIGVLTFTIPNGPEFFVIALMILTAYGLGKSVTYQHAQDSVEEYS